MPSPAKKRKLNKDVGVAPLPSRGLEYFFSKQKQQASETGPAGLGNVDADAHGRAEAGGGTARSGDDAEAQHEGMTDEELARKLQAEWDQEDAERQQDRGQLQHNHVSGRAQDGQGDIQNELAADVTTGGSKETAELPQAAASSTAPRTPEPARPVVNPFASGKGTLSLQSAASAVDTVTESIPFDESPLTFDPGKYLPELRKGWESDRGQASYSLLTHCFVIVGGTQSRIKTVDAMVNCLRILIEGDPESLLPAVGAQADTIVETTTTTELTLCV